MFTDTDEETLNAIDLIVNTNNPHRRTTSGHGPINRDPWSPHLCTAGGTLTYWKKKWRMCQQDQFQWEHINKYAETLNISPEDHLNTHPKFIKIALLAARDKWRKVRKQSNDL